MQQDPMFLGVDWPAPAAVRAVVSTRIGGCSAAPWDGLNLALHVGDDPDAVLRNRALIEAALELPASPQWLEQVHGRVVVDAASDGCVRTADAAYAQQPGVVCAVLTADCLPLLLCNRAGTEVAAVHCGWRGLAAGIIAAALQRFRSAPEDLLAWFGPAISQEAFEVGAEVREIFLADPATRDAMECAFVTSPAQGKFQADLYQLARVQLAAAGVMAVYGGGLCTVGDAHRFYSWRRDGVTGRMASLVWIQSAR
jgi:polyphenol oxidase